MMGRLDSVNTITRPSWVSSSHWLFCAITYTGTSAPTAGIILVESIHISTSLVRLLLKKAIEYAAGAASSQPQQWWTPRW